MKHNNDFIITGQYRMARARACNESQHNSLKYVMMNV